MPATANPESPTVENPRTPRQFEFAHDCFAFANELRWEYHFDYGTGKTSISKRDPRPAYVLRCFVLTRAARQFLYHAQFAADRPPLADPQAYRQRIREVNSRNPRVPALPEARVIFPGYANLNEFSRAYEAVLKSECGGAWRSYVLRSHWRMVFPISRAHQQRTALRLLAEIQRGAAPIVHLVVFPKLTMNHGMILIDADETESGVVFQAYDPNDPAKPSVITYDAANRIFSLPPNRYWIGGKLDVIEIFRSWWF